MILGTVSLILFALGMCMALLAEWNSFTEGIIFGTSGIILGLITLLIWRKMEHKAPIKFKKKTVGITIYTVFGVLVFGTGFCLCLVAQRFVLGTLIGLAGIVLLISLIPIFKGIK